MPHESKRGNASLGLSDQVESKEPGGQWQLGGLHDSAGGEGRLMAARPTLVPLERPAIDQAMFLLCAAGTDEPFWPTSLLQSGLTLLLDAIEIYELGHGHTWLELDAVYRHDRDWCVRTTVATDWSSAEASA